MSSSLYEQRVEHFADMLQSNDVHAIYRLQATLFGGNVRLSAVSVTEEHRRRTLRTWRHLGAQNIRCTSVPNAPPLSMWKVSYRTPTEQRSAVVPASSADAAKRVVLANKNKRFYSGRLTQLLDAHPFTPPQPAGGLPHAQTGTSPAV